MIPESVAERMLQPHLAEPRAGLLNPNSAQPSQSNVGLWSGRDPSKGPKSLLRCLGTERRPQEQNLLRSPGKEHSGGEHLAD